MNQAPYRTPTNPLELWTGLAAGVLGLAGLGVCLLVPTVTSDFCITRGPCPLGSAEQAAAPVLAGDLIRLWAPLFVAIAVGAIWDGLRRALLGRLLLWLATLVLLVATVPGLFVVERHYGPGIYNTFASGGTWDIHRGNLFFVPGMALALAACIASAVRRQRKDS